MGANYIIVNYDEYNSVQGKKDIIDNKIFPSANSVKNLLDKDINLKFLRKVDDSYVYKIN